MRDHTGVAAWQLAEVFNEINCCSLSKVALRVPPTGMDLRDLKKIVKFGAFKFAGLHTADRITMSIGENISALVHAGRLTIIPAQGRLAPFKMAEDEFWAMDIEPTEEEFMARAMELAARRDDLLGG